MVILLLTVVAVVLVGVSPLGLRVFEGPNGDWERLSFIGQTYGAVSALIAVLALVGVAATLVFQARETRRAVHESRRQAMAELLRMAMDDPDLDECWGPVPEDEDRKTRKQQLYTNMIVTQWNTAYRARAMEDSGLRAIATEMMSGPVGRAYWAVARNRRLVSATDTRERRFNEILDEVYRDTADTAVVHSAESASPERECSSRQGRRQGGWLVAAAFAAGAAVAGGGVAAARMLRERRPPRRWWERARRG